MSSFSKSAGVFALGSCLLITACGTRNTSSRARSPVQPPTPVPAAIEQQSEITPTQETVGPAIRADNAPTSAIRSLPAAVALRSQAASATQASNFPRAIGLLERAIRVSPRDPQTYQALAENHLALNQPEQALQIVRRALVLNPSAQQYESLTALEQKCLALL